jgi:alginate O-acetyltransferase complex protein AlgI
MWTLATALFLGFKWLTWWRSGSRDPGRSLGYLLAWPGMDAARFLDRAARSPRPTGAEWRAAAAKTALGALLFLGVAPRGTGLVAGWVAMTGLALLFHSGLFHLCSLAWRRAGVDARPLNDAPFLATSLSEFWSRRWNRGFSDLAHGLILRPLLRPLGAVGATMAVFVASGLLHEAVISVPAGGGWGLPTGYFLLQGAAVLVERSRAGRRAGLGGGLRGRAFTALLVAGPLFWLFHPPFVREVILPMVRALGVG